MTFADLKSSIQSRIWDVLYKNGWREADDFSLNLSEKTAEKIIKRKSQHNLFSIINSVKTNFFKINNVTKKEFTKELVNEIDDLLQLYKPLKINKKKKIRKDRTNIPRLDFSEETKIKTIRRQDHKCAICGRLLTILDWDHKDSDRSNNDESNCRALCPSCHGIVTRRRQMGQDASNL